MVPAKRQSVRHLTANICNISWNTSMKLESPSFFSSGTGVRQTYPCMYYRLVTNGLVEQRWRAYTWGGVRVALRMFCNCSRAFCIADTSQVGVYFLGRGTNRGLWQHSSQRPLLWEEIFLGKVLLTAALNLALPI